MVRHPSERTRPARSRRPWPPWLLPAVGAWSILMTAEVVHGTLRVLFLEPLVGEFPARQIAVFTGSAIILAITFGLIGFLRANQPSQWLGIGVVWLLLTLAFELLLGRYAFGLTWDRLLADYDLSAGGLMPMGLLVLTLAPSLAAWLRGATVPGRRGHRGTS
jgi:hypothetical protein